MIPDERDMYLGLTTPPDIWYWALEGFVSDIEVRAEVSLFCIVTWS